MSAFSEIVGEVQANAIADAQKREQLLAGARLTVAQLTSGIYRDNKSGVDWVRLYNAKLFLAMHSGDPELAKTIPGLLAECFDEAMSQSWNDGIGVGQNSIIPCNHE